MSAESGGRTKVRAGILSIKQARMSSRGPCGLEREDVRRMRGRRHSRARLWKRPSLSAGRAGHDKQGREFFGVAEGARDPVWMGDEGHER